MTRIIWRETTEGEIEVQIKAAGDLFYDLVAAIKDLHWRLRRYDPATKRWLLHPGAFEAFRERTISLDPRAVFTRDGEQQAQPPEDDGRWAKRRGGLTRPRALATLYLVPRAPEELIQPVTGPWPSSSTPTGAGQTRRWRRSMPHTNTPHYNNIDIY